MAPLSVPGRPHVIKLCIKSGTKMRDYFLDCSTEENMSSWVTSLAQTCGFCPGEERQGRSERVKREVAGGEIGLGEGMCVGGGGERWRW